MDGREAAADAAADCQQILAAVSEQAEHYARVRIAAALVRRGIEEYRQQHQDPVLLRASQLFSRLTLGSFAGVQSDFDQKDRPVLVGERSNGGLVGVEGMSDGTLDQLFLALRLATLERHCKYNEPMPLVVDDILIRFDDDRARGALEVLTELAETTQVVFFTHHHRLLELAQDMADRPCGVTIHELARPAG